MAEDQKGSIAEVLDELSPRAQKFALLIVDKPNDDLYDLYKLAGFTGDKHAAYVLKGRLDKQLGVLLEARGLNRSSWMMEVKKLNDMPLVDNRGEPVKGVTIDQKIRILQLQQKDLDSRKAAAPLVRFDVSIKGAEIKPVFSAPYTAIEAEQVKE